MYQKLREINLDLAERSSKEAERLAKIVQNRETAKFLFKEIFRLIAELDIEFTKADDVDDEELLRRKEDNPEKSLQVERLSSKIQQVYHVLPDDYDNTEIKTMETQYAALLELKKTYDANLDEKIAERELLKEKALQVSGLNIQLSKYKGYKVYYGHLFLSIGI